MRDVEMPTGYLEKVREQSVVERTRAATAEAVAACMPRVLARLMEHVDSDDEGISLKACLALLNKNLPAPLAERVVTMDRDADGEVVTEDVRELREKLFLEMQKERGRD